MSSNLRQLEGRNPILAAARIPGRLVKLSISQTIQKDDRVEEILRRARKQGIKPQKLSPKKIKRISQTGIDQGVVALAKYPPLASVPLQIKKARKAEQEPFFIMITEVFDRHNLGAIIRSAESAGVDGLVIPKDIDPYHPVVARVAMGATETLPIISASTFSTIKIFQDEAITILAADQNARNNVWDLDLRRPLAIVVGGEESGVTSTLMDKCTFLAKVPMRGKTESLNMSVAAGIFMFEAVRQRTSG